MTENIDLQDDHIVNWNRQDDIYRVRACLGSGMEDKYETEMIV